MIRPIAEYRTCDTGNWLVVLGRADETYAELERWLLSQISGVVAVRPRVTDSGSQRVVTDIRACAECGGSFVAKRRDAKYCGPTCRQRASRASRRAA